MRGAGSGLRGAGRVHFPPYLSCLHLYAPRQPNFHVRALGAEPDHVAVGEILLADNATAVEKGAVRAVVVADAVSPVAPNRVDLGVASGDIEVAVRIELEV